MSEQLKLYDPDDPSDPETRRQRMHFRKVAIEAALVAARNARPDLQLGAIALSAAGVASGAEERLLVARHELDQAVAELEAALRIEELTSEVEEDEIETAEERVAIRAAEGVSP